MKEPVLVVMAAGMGSRYGGLKQIDPVDQEGHIIMDFSIYDAVRAGFKKVIFIIKHKLLIIPVTTFYPILLLLKEADSFLHFYLLP